MPSWPCALGAPYGEMVGFPSLERGEKYTPISQPDGQYSPLPGLIVCLLHFALKKRPGGLLRRQLDFTLPFSY